MPQKDLYHNVKVAQALAPSAKLTGTINGADIDMSGFESVLFTVDVGVWTDGTHTLKLQDAPDNGAGAPGAYSDVPAANLHGAFVAITSAGQANQTQKVGYIKYNTSSPARWVRLVSTVAGTTTGAIYGASVALAGARNLPQPYTDTVG